MSGCQTEAFGPSHAARALTLLTRGKSALRVFALTMRDESNRPTYDDLMGATGAMCPISVHSSRSRAPESHVREQGLGFPLIL